MAYMVYDVICPSCGGIYLETTELFDAKKMTTGEMLRFKHKYGPDGYNWSLSFSNHDMAEALVCPDCGGALAPNGYVQVIVEGPVELPDQAEAENDKIEQMSGPENDEEDVQEPGAGSEERAGAEGLDPIAKITTLKACPECGGFFTVGQWEDHLNQHPPEIRDRIRRGTEGKAQETAKEAKKERQAPPPAKPKARSIGSGLKSMKGLIQKRLAEEEERSPDFILLQCPFCDQAFKTNHEFDEHIKTHDLEGVAQKKNGE